MMRKLLRALFRTKQTLEFEGWLNQPIPQGPPALPRPKQGYIIVAVGPGDYDIMDGDHLAGWAYRPDGDAKNRSVWSTTVGGTESRASLAREPSCAWPQGY